MDGGGSVCPHYRFSWWRPTYKWNKHFAPVDAAGKPLYSQERNSEAAKAVPECAIWHLGHALPRELAERKHRFYRERDMAPDKRSRAWLDWRGQTGDCGDGIVRRTNFEVPPIVKEALDTIHASELVGDI